MCFLCPVQTTLKLLKTALDLQNSITGDTEAVQFNQGSYELEGSYIVVFDRKVTGDVGAKFGKDYPSAKNAVKALATEILGSHQMKGEFINHVYSKTLTGVSASITAEQADALRGDSRIAYIEKIRCLPWPLLREKVRVVAVAAEVPQHRKLPGA